MQRQKYCLQSAVAPAHNALQLARPAKQWRSLVTHQQRIHHVFGLFLHSVPQSSLLQVAHLYLTDADRLQQLLAWLLEPCRVKEWQQQMPVLAIPQRGRQAGKHSRAGSSREAKRPSTGTATGEAAPLSRDTAEVHGPPSGGHL